MYYTYVLSKNGKAVYVGQTSNPRNRANHHKKDKDFDELIILNSYKTKKESLISERILISFLTLFGSGEWYNAEDIIKSFERDAHIRYKNNI